MATATPSQELLIPLSAFLPPPNAPLLRIQTGFEDEDENPFYADDGREDAEVDMGCDWSEGALAPNGCRW